MKKNIVALLALMSGIPLMAQNADGNWKLVGTENNVSVYLEPGTCRNSDVFFVRIVNDNEQAVNIEWSFWDGEKTNTLVVEGNQSVTGSCQNRQPMFMLTEVIPSGKAEGDLHPIIQVTVKP